MNELIFFAHIFVLIAAVIAALHIGITALVGLVCILAAFMNIFVIKQISLFGLCVTASDAFSVALSLAINLIQEYYTKAAAQKAVLTSFFTSLVVLFISMIHLSYTPTAADTTHAHFVPIFAAVPRIVIASLLSYLTAMYIETWIYSGLKKKWGSVALITRNYATLFLCQLLDTLLFSFLGLWGIVANIEHIILVSYSIKLIAILIMTPLVSIARIVRAAHEQSNKV